MYRIMKKWIVSMTAVLLFGSFSRLAAQNDREEVRQVIDRFFLALERSDSSSFRNLFVECVDEDYVKIIIIVKLTKKQREGCSSF